MPWKECNHMDERLRLVAKLLDGEKMALCLKIIGTFAASDRLRIWMLITGWLLYSSVKRCMLRL
jgi:hypothetical protein